MTRLLLAVVTATLFMVGAMGALSILDQMEGSQMVVARGPAPVCLQGVAR